MERPVKPSDSITFLQAFNITYVGATERKGDRIRIQSIAVREVVYISANHPYFDNAIDIAIEFLTKKGINIVSYATGLNGYVAMSPDLFSIK